MRKCNQMVHSIFEFLNPRYRKHMWTGNFDQVWLVNIRPSVCVNRNQEKRWSYLKQAGRLLACMGSQANHKWRCLIFDIAWDIRKYWPISNVTCPVLCSNLVFIISSFIPPCVTVKMNANFTVFHWSERSGFLFLKNSLFKTRKKKYEKRRDLLCWLISIRILILLM